MNHEIQQHPKQQQANGQATENQHQSECVQFIEAAQEVWWEMLNWHDLLPRGWAEMQIAWERRRRVARAVDACLDYQEIANRMGVARERVRQIYLKDWKERDLPPPVERFMAKGRLSDLRAIASLMKRNAS